MKRFLMKYGGGLALLALGVVWLIPALAFGTPTPTPFENIGDAIKEIGDAAKATKGVAGAAAWAAWAALSVALLKGFWMLVGRVPAFAKKVKGWGTEINIIIPALIAVAYAIGNKDWLGVIIIVSTGPIMGTAHDLGQWIWKLKKKAGPSADMED